MFGEWPADHRSLVGVQGLQQQVGQPYLLGQGCHLSICAIAAFDVDIHSANKIHATSAVEVKDVRRSIMFLNSGLYFSKLHINRFHPVAPRRSNVQVESPAGHGGLPIPSL